jgi:hypothetical protein
MKAITLLIAFALIAMASASTTFGINAQYAWWINFVLANNNISTYMTCLLGGWAAATFANDAGDWFYYCL